MSAPSDDARFTECAADCGRPLDVTERHVTVEHRFEVQYPPGHVAEIGSATGASYHVACDPQQGRPVWENVPPADLPATLASDLTGAELIEAERWRQIDREGWTPQHDAGHRAEHLSRAAACYATPPHLRTYLKAIGFGSGNYKPAPIGWPWAAHCWKPTPDDRIRELVKAGALIAAEIDRLNARKLDGAS